MNQLSGVTDFIKVPVSIDLFISHPVITKVVLSTVLPVGLLFIIVLLAFYLFLNIIQHKKIGLFLLSMIFTLFVLGMYLFISPLAMIARNPSSSIIIAAIVDDKKILNYFIFKQYYIIIDIDGKKYGVITSKEIYSMSKYQKHATFDYTLYTYVIKGKSTMYRFCKPENKVKAERGNLQ